MQGYQADHPNIELLRLKNFTIGRKLDDEEITGPGFLGRIAGLVGTMAPFVSAPSCQPLFNLSKGRVDQAPAITAAYYVCHEAISSSTSTAEIPPQPSCLSRMATTCKDIVVRRPTR
jgi:Conserved hypothetical protein (DUF2461)